jgi:YbgC/YbaW family acyl-CoA thioester hydrolase
MPAAGRSSKIELRVRWGETDAFGIVFYPNYYAWFDVAALELFRASGRLTIPHAKDAFGFPLIESGARFHAPLFPDDLMSIETVVAEVRSKALRLEHTVRRGDTLIANGFEVRVFAGSDGNGGLVTAPIPDDLRDWLLHVS